MGGKIYVQNLLSFCFSSNTETTTKRKGIHLWHNHENEDTEACKVNKLHISSLYINQSLHNDTLPDTQRLGIPEYCEVTQHGN